jgi:hypothetical protein
MRCKILSPCVHKVDGILAELIPPLHELSSWNDSCTMIII